MKEKKNKVIKNSNQSVNCLLDNTDATWTFNSSLWEEHYTFFDVNYEPTLSLRHSALSD